MPRDAALTRQRIFDAAAAEFSAHGLAGARVDRIADASGANKAMIYRYFGSKDDLFDAVFDTLIVERLDAVPIDADDLPGYVVRLFDTNRAGPEPMRMSYWDRLERDAVGAGGEQVRRAITERVKAVRHAQRAGTVSGALPAQSIVDLILALSLSRVEDDLTKSELTRHRAALRKAVALMTSPG